ncbi:MAG: mechanosensitive ion channel family protein [Gammaproteobacteria bacterium]|nr:mechanosensitive ion channel family protein [Gammaproteobacteria bacterium]
MNRISPVLTRIATLLCVLLSLVVSATSIAQSPLADIYQNDAEVESAITIELDALTAEERRAMLAKLSDTQVRQLILENWEKQANDEPPLSEMGMVGGFNENLQQFRSAFKDALSQWRRLPEIIPFLFSQLIPYGQSASILFWVVLGCLSIFVVAFIVERIYLRLIKTFRERIDNTPHDSFTSKLGYLTLRLILRLTGVGIFALTAIGSLFIINPPSPSIRIALLTYIIAIIVFRIIIHISRFLLAPDSEANRLIPLSDGDAKRMHYQMLCVATFAVFVFPTLNLIGDLGMDKRVMDLAGFIAGGIFIFMLIFFTWRIRKPIRDILRGDNELSGFSGWCREAIAQMWHVFFTILYLVIWIAATNSALTGYEFTTSAAFGSLLVLGIFPLIGGAIRGVLADSARQNSLSVVNGMEKEASDTEIQRGNSTATMMQPVIGLAVTIFAVLTMAWLWGVNLTSMAGNSFGSKVLSTALDILIVLALAYVIWVIIVRAMQPYMPIETAAAGPGDEGGGTGASRISTLMPLFRKFAFITLIIITSMVILSSLGVNIGPLIAGAGVIGIAIGFGAQSLVRDVISGLFFLMDDAFRKGEYIEMDNIKGTVENISIRSFQLRHHNGPIHTIPYGEIKSITNYSRDWAIMKFEIRIPFETDVDMVRRLIKKVGQKMMDDEEIGPLLIEPMKSQGVNRMDDSALIVRCKFTAHPGHQFYVRREAFRRIQEAFAEKGLQFAPRRVLVESVGATSDNSNDNAAAAGAAGNLDTQTPTKGADDRG